MAHGTDFDTIGHPPRSEAGSAFPRPGGNWRDGRWEGVFDPQDGMTLRDYFAGQALSGRAVPPDPDAAAWVALQCYKVADAMIAEREK